MIGKEEFLRIIIIVGLDFAKVEGAVQSGGSRTVSPPKRPHIPVLPGLEYEVSSIVLVLTMLFLMAPFGVLYFIKIFEIPSGIDRCIGPKLF